MQSYLERVLLGSAINLALLLPFFALAFLTTRRGKSAAKPVLLFVALFVLDMACIWSFKLVQVIPAWGGWNWQGKVLEAGWPVLLALALPAVFAVSRVGLTLPEDKRSWRTTAMTCALFTAIGIPVMLLMGAHFGVQKDLPTFAYEATMPGLGEELAYRGVFLMLLNEAFGRPWRFAGIQFGWGFIIVSAMFGILHGVDAPSLNKIHIIWAGMIFPTITGVVLAWLRERTGSVWPGVVFHNFVNTLSQFFN